MNREIWPGWVCVSLVCCCAVISCSAQPEPAAVEQPAETAAEALADPTAEEAQEIEAFVRGWVAQRAGEGAVYDIPAHADHDVSGTLTGFHTVHRKDEDTYSVCVDFADGESSYDVDFFVDRTADGLSVAEHYLHKVNGEAVM